MLFTQVIDKPSAMYDTLRDSEKWVESKHERCERLSIVPV